MYQTALDICLNGTLRSRITREFFGNSAHFPIILILLELLLGGVQDYLSEPDVYALLFAAGFQAYWLGKRAYHGQASPLLGNLIAPGIYTVAEVIIEAHDLNLTESVLDFFSATHHQAFWAFALTIGILQHAHLYSATGFGANLLIMLENLTRTLILGVMYFIFEHTASAGTQTTLHLFLHDRSHIFIILSLVFIGLLLGAAHLSAEAFLLRLRDTNQQLQTYSTWLLGRQLLDSAVQNPVALTLQRRNRTVLFMDIRGFTAWCEVQPPEHVVAMLNGYFEKAETCWSGKDIFPQVIKVKYTGDEVMIVFGCAQAALAATRDLCRIIADFLQPYQLGAGIGVHYGALAEGLLGSPEARSYDIIGDTVNTAKRICDCATAGEVLLSRPLCDHLSAAPSGKTRYINVKGKSTALEVLVLPQNKT